MANNNLPTLLGAFDAPVRSRWRIHPWNVWESRYRLVTGLSSKF
jgi:hypothetical protein